MWRVVHDCGAEFQLTGVTPAEGSHNNLMHKFSLRIEIDIIESSKQRSTCKYSSSKTCLRVYSTSV